MERARKLLGFSLLALGFIWILWDCTAGFTAYQYTRWIWQTKHLPPGDTIKPTEASEALLDLSLALNTKHRQVLIPAVLMLAGGVLLGLRRAASPTVIVPAGRFRSDRRG